MKADPALDKPMIPGQCWAMITLHVNSAFGSMGQCSKHARPGTHTCHWHKDWEENAKELDHRLSRTSEGT